MIDLSCQPWTASSSILMRQAAHRNGKHDQEKKRMNWGGTKLGRRNVGFRGLRFVVELECRVVVGYAAKIVTKNRLVPIERLPQGGTFAPFYRHHKLKLSLFMSEDRPLCRVRSF